jgi:hypothetical protein
MIHIPTDSTTIQAGINAAVDGDTVMVHPGTYVENIDFLGKAIVVMSELGPEFTVIDGNQEGSAVTFMTGETTASIIEGFTITNGSGTWVDSYWEYGGGGIYCDGSAPTIQYNRINGNTANNAGGIGVIFASSAVITHNIIFDNLADVTPGRIGGGGGIVVAFNSDAIVSHNDIYGNTSMKAGGGIACAFDCNPEIEYNTIRDNVATDYGGGIQIYSNTAGTFAHNIIMGNSSLGSNGAGGLSCRLGASPVIANNLIIDNSAATYGGGMRCFDDATPTIINNLLIGNEANISGGGIECDNGAFATITNTILWNNQAPAGTELWIGPRSGPPAILTISYSDVKGGMTSVYVDPGSTLNWGAGMIDDDPLCRDPAADDFHLMATACGDALDSPCIDAGDPSIIDTLLDCSWGLGTTRSDMGAYGGGGSASGIDVGPDLTQGGFALAQCYPNPFNPSTRITYMISAGADDSSTLLRVYDLAGRVVRTLVDAPRTAGIHTATWDATSQAGAPVAGGVYFYQLKVGGETQTRRMILVR